MKPMIENFKLYGGENYWRKEAMLGLRNAEKPKP